jgi:hypothetical protein
MPFPRRFPPPWTMDEHNDACFIVRDKTGQALAYFYFEKSPGRRSAAKLLKIEALASIHFEDRRHQAIFVGIIYHQLPRLLPE